MYVTSDTKSQRLLVTRHRLSCEKVNLHNTLITWAWDAYAHTNTLVVSWCCGSSNDVTFSLFCVSHYHKVQVFIQLLQILISANECKISVGLSVPKNQATVQLTWTDKPTTGSWIARPQNVHYWAVIWWEVDPFGGPLGTPEVSCHDDRKNRFSF